MQLQNDCPEACDYISPNSWGNWPALYCWYVQAAAD